MTEIRYAELLAKLGGRLMKKSQLDCAIESLETEKIVLQLAIDKLRQQAAQKVAKARGKKPAPVVAMADRSS